MMTQVFHFWVHDSVPEAEYVVKTDNDVFLRLDVIAKELVSLPRTYALSYNGDSLGNYYFNKLRDIRKRKTKGLAGAKT
jgi:hypothetical protein